MKFYLPEMCKILGSLQEYVPTRIVNSTLDVGDKSLCFTFVWEAHVVSAAQSVKSTQGEETLVLLSTNVINSFVLLSSLLAQRQGTVAIDSIYKL